LETELRIQWKFKSDRTPPSNNPVLTRQFASGKLTPTAIPTTIAITCSIRRVNLLPESVDSARCEPLFAFSGISKACNFTRAFG
jgi:hypothetical protein